MKLKYHDYQSLRSVDASVAPVVRIRMSTVKLGLFGRTTSVCNVTLKVVSQWAVTETSRRLRIVK